MQIYINIYIYQCVCQEFFGALKLLNSNQKFYELFLDKENIMISKNSKQLLRLKWKMSRRDIKKRISFCLSSVISELEKTHVMKFVIYRHASNLNSWRHNWFLTICESRRAL